MLKKNSWRSPKINIDNYTLPSVVSCHEITTSITIKHYTIPHNHTISQLLTIDYPNQYQLLDHYQSAQNLLQTVDFNPLPPSCVCVSAHRLQCRILSSNVIPEFLSRLWGIIFRLQADVLCTVYHRLVRVMYCGRGAPYVLSIYLARVFSSCMLVVFTHVPVSVSAIAIKKINMHLVRSSNISYLPKHCISNK